MKTCPFCAAGIPDSAQFCANCGNMLPPYEMPVQHVNNSRSGKKILLILIPVLVFLLIAGAVGGVLAWRYLSNRGDKTAVSESVSVSEAETTAAAATRAETTTKRNAPTTSAGFSRQTKTEAPTTRGFSRAEATTAPPATQAQPTGQPVRVGDYDQYDVNIFLSNFTEVGLRRDLNSFAKNGDFAAFVMRHNYINAHDTITVSGTTARLSGDIMRNNTEYFFRRIVPDQSRGGVTYDVDSDVYTADVRDVMADIPYGECRSLAVAKSVTQQDMYSFRVVYGIFESDQSVTGFYSQTFEQAEANAALRYVGDDAVVLTYDSTGLYVVAQ